MKKTVSVIVVKEIVLPSESNETIPIDSIVFVDLDKMVAVWNNQHFDIFSDEFRVFN